MAAILRVFEAGHVGCWGALTISFDCGDKAAYLWVQSLPARQSSLIRILSNESVKKQLKEKIILNPNFVILQYYPGK